MVNCVTGPWIFSCLLLPSRKPMIKEREELIVDANSRPIFDWRPLWRYRELFYFFTWRDIKVKYKQTVFGFMWAVLQPLLMMLVFTFFFGKTFDVTSPGIPYPIFILSGLLIWNTFAAALNSSANSMINNALIIKKIYFPRLIIPVSSLLVALFDFLMSFTVFIGVLFYFGQDVSVHAIWCWPLAIGICAAATIGPGTLLSALSLKYRDFRYVLPFLIQVLFFISPVLYPVSLVKFTIVKYILIVSPVYASIELFRFPISQSAPDPHLLAVSIICTIAFMLAGLIYFKKTEDFFGDFA